ncbi:MAG: HAMP domain-containing histidine kinase, partial [Acidimicrobiia bacterium]|nr:HAMP domain-containing histidine kinase [Acidimicrobiia bacterium]
EALLHDLRTGLLSIEAAMAGVDDPASGPIRSETARLRDLAAKRKRKVAEFDLIPGIRDMAIARRAGGVVIDLRLPTAAQVIGEETEVMSIIDNMLSNANRHGSGPIRLELQEQGPAVHVAVIDSGKVAPDADTDRFFRRGYTTHKDGEGIGLDRARTLAEQNGGSLRYIPGPKGETSFVLTMPSAAGLHENNKRPAMAWSAPAPSPSAPVGS